MSELFTITESAAKQIRKIVDGQDKMLKVSITSGGCSGFNYAMDLITEEELEETDQIVEQHDLKIIIDGLTMMYIIGTELDYVEELIGSAFVFNNPLATAQCGCGTSFAV